jgi:catechol 2,3-dioxygenase-like lactoylglutathione lyase family enzyme
VTVLGIDHIQLAMPAGREADARRYYVDMLGMEERPKPPELAGRGGAWFRRGKVEVHLGVDPDFRPARKAHPAFLVRGLDELIGRLRLAGFEVDTSQPALPGYRRAHVFDPFGNRLELMEPLGLRKEP